MSNPATGSSRRAARPVGTHANSACQTARPEKMQWQKSLRPAAAHAAGRAGGGHQNAAVQPPPAAQPRAAAQNPPAPDCRTQQKAYASANCNNRMHQAHHAQAAPKSHRRAPAARRGWRCKRPAPAAPVRQTTATAAASAPSGKAQTHPARPQTCAAGRANGWWTGS